MNFGLIGRSLKHTFSPKYFEEKFRKEHIDGVRYDAYPLDFIEEVFNIIPMLQGFNVTIPYKEEILPFLDYIDPPAEAIGAVNCVKISDQGKLTGYNTDYYGFRLSLQDFLNGYQPKGALVLGSGGASKAVRKALADMGISYLIVSRTRGDLRYEDLTKDDFLTHSLIINTTPLGMYPYVDSCPPLPYGYLHNENYLYDLVYNPEKTLFLTHGKNQGAKTINGLQMLILQAEKSWEIWNNKTMI